MAEVYFFCLKVCGIMKSVSEITSCLFKILCIGAILGNFKFFFFGVHPLRMTTTSSSTLKVGLVVAEEANA